MKHKGPYNGELDPLDSFHSHAKNRDPTCKQREMLKRGAEKLREIGTVVSQPNCNAAHAHAILDDLIRMCQGGHTRYADINILDTGVSHYLASDLGAEEIHTIGNLASCCATNLPGTISLMEALTAALAALKWVVNLDQERLGV